MYLFTYRSTSPLATFGSAHSLEIPFMFGVIDDLDAIAFTGRDPGRRALMQQILGAWLQFAKSGDPGQPGAAWPRYDTASRQTMKLGVKTQLIKDPPSRQRAGWDSVPFDNLSPSGPQVSAFLSENGPP